MFFPHLSSSTNLSTIKNFKNSDFSFPSKKCSLSTWKLKTLPSFNFYTGHTILYSSSSLSAKLNGNIDAHTCPSIAYFPLFTCTKTALHPFTPSLVCEWVSERASKFIDSFPEGRKTNAISSNGLFLNISPNSLKLFERIDWKSGDERERWRARQKSCWNWRPEGIEVGTIYAETWLCFVFERARQLLLSRELDADVKKGVKWRVKKSAKQMNGGVMWWFENDEQEEDEEENWDWCDAVQFVIWWWGMNTPFHRVRYKQKDVEWVSTQFEKFRLKIERNSRFLSSGNEEESEERWKE